MIKKILIIEAYTDSNIGSCALVENSIYLLKIKYPDSEIKLMAHYPNAFSERYGVEVVKDVFKYPFLKNRVYQYWWLARTISWMFFIYVLPKWSSRLFFKKKVKEYFWADWIVSIGAERINDKYIKNEFFSEYTYKLAKRFGKKMILFPCTIGPFLHSYTKRIFKNVGNDIDLIYTRDTESYNITKELLNKNVRIVNTYDVAIIQAWKEVKRNENSLSGKPIVGISVMKWTYLANKYETSYSNYSAYVNEMSILVDEIIRKYDVLITLFPTNYPVNAGIGDDLGVAFEIREHVKAKEKVDIVRKLLSPTEFKNRLSLSEVNITTRMHACIFSTGAFVPTISINYLFKLRSYMNDLGLSEFSVDIEDFNHEIVLDMFDKLWNCKDYWRDFIKVRIDKNRSQLFNSLNELDALL